MKLPLVLTLRKVGPAITGPRRWRLIGRGFGQRRYASPASAILAARRFGLARGLAVEVRLAGASYGARARVS